jgi:hypothetical protein
MAMRIMNAQSLRFAAEKSKEYVGSMCHTIEPTDRKGYANCQDYDPNPDCCHTTVAFL